ncbi:RidA family protein [Paraglaciecola chathamensis]|uniref:RidA family protein n=1 Tax=Paraglaciecola chathamensis TaxID=368405 RepID=UPI002700747A|nr:RidA family protein [Paraglaciecola chathamensis]MDO6561504.1 RidA family protein [Paraglaciecola chathamensis]
MNKFLLAGMLSINLAISGSALANDTPEERIKAAGFTLPEPVKPIANYVTWRRSGNTLYLSGHGACEGKSVLGKLGDTLNVEQGYEAAKRVGLCALSTIKSAVGDLSKVKQVLQINGMVAAVPAFTDHSKVINGFSDLFVTAFGDDGKAARAAVGMSGLPGNMSVEVSAVIELKN